MAQKLYFVTVHTAAVDHGGTDSNVFVAIRASNGRLSSFCLLDDPSYDDLEQGQIDTFIFWDEDFDLGSDFEGFAIAVGPSGNDPSWYLDSILVGEWANGDIGRAAGQVYSPPKYIGQHSMPVGAQIVLPSAFRHSGNPNPPGNPIAPFVGDLRKMSSAELERLRLSKNVTT